MKAMLFQAVVLTVFLFQTSLASAEHWLDGCVSTPTSCSDLACSDVACDCTGGACDAAGCDSCAGSRFGCLDRLERIAKRINRRGWIKPSDHCFDDFISPMIDFVHFEDPRNLTELRPIFLHHRFPSTLGPGAIPAGGDLQLFAAQFRIALTDRLSLIAVKDGYVIDNSEGTLDTLLDSGWVDVTAGLKYNFLRNTETGTLGSAGFTYEIPLGREATLQGYGDGVFHFFASGGQRLMCGDAHVLTSFGWQLPVDQSIQSTTVHWNNHFDYKLTDSVYLFTENSWWHWVSDASNGTALGVSGQDLLNLSANDVDGNHLVTHNIGAKYKPHGGLELGFAYEFPLTDFKDIIQDRWQFEAIFRY